MIMENNELPEIVINKDNQSPILGKRNITVEEYYDLMHHLHTLESLGIGYGECKNAWYEGAEKDVTIDNFVLRKGSIVYIKFLYSLKTTTSANVDSDVISLNINNTGAKPIYYNGKTIIDNNIIKAGDIVTLLYDGEIYNLISVNRDFNDDTSVVYYGECDDVIHVSEKSVTIDNFILKNGVMVYIRFSNDILFFSSITLNINNTGAFPIYYRGSQLNRETDIDNSIRDDNIGILFMYNNGHYDIICADNGATRPQSTRVTNFKLGQTYAVCDAAENKINKNIEKFSVPSIEFGVDGGIISVRFINNVCANANLAGGSGIKTRPIYHRGAPIEAGVIKAGDTATFIYDGESETYNLISII